MLPYSDDFDTQEKQAQVSAFPGHTISNKSTVFATAAGLSAPLSDGSVPLGQLEEYSEASSNDGAYHALRRAKTAFIRAYHMPRGRPSKWTIERLW